MKKLKQEKGASLVFLVIVIAILLVILRNIIS